MQNDYTCKEPGKPKQLSRGESKQTDKIPEENFVDFYFLKSVGWIFMEIVAVGYTWCEFKDSGHRRTAVNFQ